MKEEQQQLFDLKDRDSKASRGQKVKLDYQTASLSIIPCATLIYKYQCSLPGNEVD